MFGSSKLIWFEIAGWKIRHLFSASIWCGVSRQALFRNKDDDKHIYVRNGPGKWQN